MKEEKQRIDVVEVESGINNSSIDINSCEGKKLIEVVEKESVIKKPED